jgi:GMP reductase
MWTFFILKNMIAKDFDDYLIKPSEKTNIESRKDICSYDKHFILPIFTAPMYDVTYKSYEQNFNNFRGIHTIVPRGTSEDELPHNWFKQFKSLNAFEPTSKPIWYSISLKGFIQCYIEEHNEAIFRFNYPIHHILIDQANGHMELMHDIVKKVKEKYGNALVIMVGNVANSLTYGRLSKAGADYVRIGVGMGSRCTTTANVAIGTGMATLISECYEISEQMLAHSEKPAKIVADGGIRGYSDIIKALALGADYVMLGSILNKTIESAGQKYFLKYFKVSNRTAKMLYFLGFKNSLTVDYRGMSTKLIQKEMKRNRMTTSEGISKRNKVEYTFNSWKENFDDYLRSAMSYTNSLTIDDFRGTDCIHEVSMNVFRRMNK